MLAGSKKGMFTQSKMEKRFQIMAGARCLRTIVSNLKFFFFFILRFFALESKSKQKFRFQCSPNENKKRNEKEKKKIDLLSLIDSHSVGS